MTLVNIDLRNQGYETSPGDRVVFYSLLVREGDFGTISTAPVEVELTDGKASVDLAPGPVGVQIIAKQVADTRVKVGEVPPSGPTTLNAVMMVTPAYTPALQKMMIAAIERAKEIALGQVDGAVSMAIDAEVGEAIYTATSSAVSAANSATVAQQSASSADTRATSAETAAGNAVSRVEALEVVGGFAPGEPADGQTANFIAQPDTLTRKALNASYITHVLTATQLNGMTFPVGAVVRTNGYHSLGDGGACTYLTIPAVEKSYDLPGIGCAYRPQNTNGAISPKQFGTYNNGIDFDNFPLQACYDFSADYRALTIDGQGLTYTIGPVNEYNDPLRGFAHKGAIMPSGRTIMNAHFFVHESATPGTCAFSVDLSESGGSTHITGCSFDGNRDALIAAGVNFSGREDAGMHLVHLYSREGAAQIPGEKDFVPVGDIYFTDCHFSNAFSYGVALVETIDALMRLEDCNFDMQGICVLLHATRTEIDGGRITLGERRPGMGIDPLHAEAELSANYSGEKRLSLDVRNIRFYADSAPNIALVKIHYSPMQGVSWDSIVIDNCSGSGSTGMFNVYTGTSAVHPWNGSTLEIGQLSITNCSSGDREMSWMSAPSNGSNPIHIKEMWVDKVPKTNRLFFDGILVDRLRVGEYALGGISPEARSFLVQDTTIGELEIGRVVGGTYSNGFLRDFTSSKIEKLSILGGDITQHDHSFLEGDFEEVHISGLTIRPVGEGVRRVLAARGPRLEMTIRDVLMLSGTNQWVLVESSTASEGWVHARNVRHISGLTPTVSVNRFPPERKILEQVAPLIPAPAGG